jgi:hypothetical protein
MERKAIHEMNQKNAKDLIRCETALIEGLEEVERYRSIIRYWSVRAENTAPQTSHSFAAGTIGWSIVASPVMLRGEPTDA